MSLWLGLLIAAIVFLILGFAVAAKWLFIVAVILLVVGLVGIGNGRRTRV